MEDKISQYREYSLSICQNLLLALREFQEDTDMFFGSEIRKAYITATEKAINQVSKIQTSIRNL